MKGSDQGTASSPLPVKPWGRGIKNHQISFGYREEGDCPSTFLDTGWNFKSPQIKGPLLERKNTVLGFTVGSRNTSGIQIVAKSTARVILSDFGNQAIVVVRKYPYSVPYHITLYQTCYSPHYALISHPV